MKKEIVGSSDRSLAVLFVRIFEGEKRMRNKQHKFILKAFLEEKIPTGIYESEYKPELISMDSVVGGYCTQVLRGRKIQNLSKGGVTSQEDKGLFSKLINELSGEKKEEVIIYYRLLVLAELIIKQYL